MKMIEFGFDALSEQASDQPTNEPLHIDETILD